MKKSSLALAAMAIAAGLAAPITVAGPTRATTGPDYTFVSAPDFFNADIGTVAHLPGGPEHIAEFGDSTSPDWEELIDQMYAQYRAEGTRDVLVAGDLVEGHWGRDTEGTTIFGDVHAGDQAREEVVRRAGDTYYSQWVQRMRDHGLVPRTALGDHDIGDNPWRATSTMDTERQSYTTFKHSAHETFKDVFSDHLIDPFGYRQHPTRGPSQRTAYAKYLHPEVLLVTVNVFQRTDDNVVAQLDGPQQRWLEGVLGRARQRGIDWIIVQGHTPVARPVVAKGSSRLMYRGGRQSQFWRTLRRHRVDFYFAGEVHAVSVVHAGGVTQIAHGATIPGGQGKYLVGRVYGNRIRLQLKCWEPAVKDASNGYLWQTDKPGRIPAGVTLGAGPVVEGTLVQTKDNQILRRTGWLATNEPE